MIDKGDYFLLEPGEKLPDSVKSALFIIADGIVRRMSRVHRRGKPQNIYCMWRG